MAVPWVCLRFVIVVFPDHTHYFSAKVVKKLLVPYKNFVIDGASESMLNLML